VSSRLNDDSVHPQYHFRGVLEHKNGESTEVCAESLCVWALPGNVAAPSAVPGTGDEFRHFEPGLGPGVERMRRSAYE